MDSWLILSVIFAYEILLHYCIFASYKFCAENVRWNSGRRNFSRLSFQMVRAWEEIAQELWTWPRMLRTSSSVSFTSFPSDRNTSPGYFSLSILPAMRRWPTSWGISSSHLNASQRSAYRLITAAYCRIYIYIASTDWETHRLRSERQINRFVTSNVADTLMISRNVFVNTVLGHFWTPIEHYSIGVQKRRGCTTFCESDGDDFAGRQEEGGDGATGKADGARRGENVVVFFAIFLM